MSPPFGASMSHRHRAVVASRLPAVKMVVQATRHVTACGLLLTCVAAALVAASKDSGDRVAAFASAVNLVAFVHYVSMQSPLDVVRFYTQTDAVAGDESSVVVRYLDWAITLPVMCLDLCELGRLANPASEPFLEDHHVAMFAAWCIGLGAAGETAAVLGHAFLAAFLGLLSSVAIAIAMFSILSPVYALGDAPAHAREDASAVAILTLTWVGYPVFWVLRTSFGGNARVDLISDVGFSSLDLVSKGGLAYWAAKRGT